MGEGSFDRDRHIADTLRIAGEREHVGGRVDTEETTVEVAELGIAGQAQTEARARRHVELIAAVTEERPEACLRDDTTLSRGERWIADDAHPHGNRCVRCF